MKLTAIGGSATFGVNIEPQDTWPKQLETLCREAGWHVSVENRASNAIAISAFAERLLHIERTDPQDLYLFQIPMTGRLNFGVNGTRRIREEDHGKEMVFGWSALNGHLSPTRLNWNKGFLYLKPPLDKLSETYHFAIIKRNNPSASYEEFAAFVRFWDANICDSDLELISYVKEIFLLQQVLRNLQKPCLMFQWNGECLRNLAHRTEPFYSLIDWTEFAQNGERTAIDYLQKSHANQFLNFLTDEYFHLSRAGNRIIAEEFVFPEILRWQPVAS
jgi:hypothetical protein